MKCKLYECEDEANPPFKFCSGTHGYIFKNRQAEMDLWFNANEEIKQSAWYYQTKLEGNKPYRANHTIEEVELLIA